MDTSLSQDSSSNAPLIIYFHRVPNISLSPFMAQEIEKTINRIDKDYEKFKLEQIFKYDIKEE